ncbi:MAG: flavin reductase [Pseudomonadota bacterium]
MSDGVREAGIDKRALRQTLGQFATGVTVVTCLGPDGDPVGMTANSFASVSLDPPLVLWSVDRTARSFDVFAGAKAFAFSVLAQDQAGLSNRFASPGTEKFAAGGWSAGREGVPLIDHAAAHIECRQHATFEGGDHLIIVGEVLAFHRFTRRPLVFSQGRYGAVAPDPGTMAGAGKDAADMHPYDDFLVPLLFRAYNHMFRAFSRTLSNQEATGAEMRILALLSAAGPLEAEPLLTRTMLSRSSFSEARQRVIAGALATADGAKMNITEAGRTRLAELLREAAALERQSTQALDSAEVELLRDLLRKLVLHHDAST